MWKTFIWDNKSYILKINYRDDYKILLTDLSNVWTEELTKQQIFSRCEEMNPLIQADEETFINTTIALLSDTNCEVDYNVIKTDNSIKLECKSQMEEIYFKFLVDFHISNILTFCEEFAKPLINTIQFLENQQDKLCDVIEKKDNEIKRHIYENGELQKVQLITEKFNKDEVIFMPSYLCCRIFSNHESFALEDEITNVKKENVDKPEIKKKKVLTLAHKIMMKRPYANKIHTSNNRKQKKM